MHLLAKDGAILSSGGPEAVTIHARNTRPQNAVPPILTVGIGHRFYNPELGRWISRDPLCDTKARSVYAAVQDEPIAGVDHLGLFVVCGDPFWTPLTRWRDVAGTETFHEVADIWRFLAYLQLPPLMSAYRIYPVVQQSQARLYLQLCCDTSDGSVFAREQWRDTGNRRWRKTGPGRIEWRGPFPPNSLA